MARYKPLSGDLTTMPQYTKGLSLQEDEVLIGVYENMPGAPDESIIITDFGIHIVQEGRWEFIAYDQIDRIEGPPNKQNAEGLVAHLADHSVVPIPVKGGDGKFRDAFEFLRFLSRVTEDIRSQA